MNTPHALCCIKDAICGLLEGHEGLSVSCNEDDCWDSVELNEYGYCAANIRITSSRNTGSKKNRKLSDGTVVCTYDSVLPIDIEIYAVECDDSFCKATSVAGFVMTQFMADSPDIPVRRVRYIGDSYGTTARGDIQFTLITIQLEIDYIFAPQKPWLLWKGTN